MNAQSMPSQASTDTIIARIESRGNYSAIRFERRVFNAITNAGGNKITDRIRSIHSCSQDTAKVLYSMSFGAYQIMGFNIWGILEYSHKYIDFINDKSAQNNCFQSFLLQKAIAFSPEEMARDPDKALKFAIRYNGSPNYATLIKNALDYYGVK